MPKKVICTLPNASESINGHEFELTDEGAVSKNVLSDKDAARFEKIPGYQVVDASGGGTEGDENPPEGKAAGKTAGGKKAATKTDEGGE